jgi:putative sugar O-methyltransferase
MKLKAYFHKTLNSVLKILKRYNYTIIEKQHLYEWQRNLQTQPSYKPSALPKEAEEYLQLDNPRLQDLQSRYDSFNSEVTAPLTWTDDLVRPEDVLYPRGDNAYVWQLRGQNMNSMAYALTTYYVKSIDNLRLLEKLKEDNLFGNFTFHIGNKFISRDLLDSIMEIYFLEKHLNLSDLKDMTILDIGAGYGRLAHRMTSALPNIKEYLCTDGVAVSSFISDYYLRFRGLEDRAKVIPLDRIENTLCYKSVDLAINIHSFSECNISAIDWWMSLLKKSKVKYLMIVPNSGSHGGEHLLTNDGKDFGEVIEKHGYKLAVKNPKYRDPIVQKYAINPTYHYLFQLQESKPA